MEARTSRNLRRGILIVTDVMGREDGQTMAEYGVVLAVIVLGIVVTLGMLSTGINGALSSVIGYL